jgi:hypothetical protein
MTRKLVVMVFLTLCKVLIDSQNGRLIFTTKEPFGNYYFLKLSNTGSGENYDDAVLIIQTKEICF